MNAKVHRIIPEVANTALFAFNILFLNNCHE